jgi:hypothetical protein
VEVTLLIFALLSLSVLSALCLLVLEYQNKRTRRWSRMWSELEQSPRTTRLHAADRTDHPVLLHDLSAAD